MLAVAHGASTAAGLLGLVGSVGTADGGSASSGGKQDPMAPSIYLFTPVVGPFLAAKVDGCGAICIVDGAVQSAGLGLIVFGLVAREPVLVRNRLALSVAPARIGSSGEGLELFGRF